MPRRTGRAARDVRPLGVREAAAARQAPADRVRPRARARARATAGAAAIDLRLAIPAAAGWSATAVAIGVRGSAAPSAAVAAALAVALALSAAWGGAARVSRRAGRGRRPGTRRLGRARGSRRPTAAARPGPLRGAAGLAVAAGVAAMLLGAAAAREPLRHPADLEAAAASDGMVVADVLLDESPAPVAAHAKGGSGSPGGAGAAGGSGPPARIRIVGRVTALHVGREERGRIADATVIPASPVPVVVFAPASALPSVAGGRRPGVGSTMRLSAAVRPADPADPAAYLLLARGALEPVARPDGALAVADGLRAGLTHAASALPGPGARLLPGLAIGDVSAVPSDLAQTMRDSSLTHLTAVSGANCAVIVGLVLLIAAAAGLRRPARALAALTALAAFVVLVTPQPSVLRAAVMATVLIVSTAAGRPSRGLPALALAVVVLLAGDPWLARDLGFALSVLATAGLLTLAPPLADRLARRMPRRLAEALAIPVAAQVACQPVLLVLQPGLPVHGVLANVLAEPAAAPATVAGLVACVLLPVWPAAGGLVLRLAWLPSSWIAAVARVTSELPAGRIPWPTGPGGVAALTVASALVVAALALGRGPGQRRPARAAARTDAADPAAGPPVPASGPPHRRRGPQQTASSGLSGTGDVPPDG